MVLITIVSHFADLHKEHFSLFFPQRSGSAVVAADKDSVRDLSQAGGFEPRPSCSPFHPVNNCKSDIHIDRPVGD